jgi:thiol-disulfide isomerase/thioredoxin
LNSPASSAESKIRRGESGGAEAESSAARWGDDEDSLAAPPDGDKTGHFWMLFALLVLAAGTLIALQARRPALPSEFADLLLPPLEVGGWLNTDRPLAADDLRGKVVLVNFWATDCPGCVLQLPLLESYARRFAEEDVVIVGLTPEKNTFGEVKRFVEREPGIIWPIGYGAGFAFEMMGIGLTPTYILYDRSGKSVWGGHTLRGVDDATIEALARK